ncbi:polysaccharide deacetylase family protein [Verrucomicrobiaceae bacterium 227]
MKRSLFNLLVCGFVAVPLWGQELTPPAPEIEPAVVLEDDGSRVSVLGYHVFHATKPATEMLIPTAKFRKQMELVKNSNVPVITMPQFLAWRRGETELPPQSFLITMDDGWKSVYTEAYPIMKELQLPFTLFLYKNYVGSERGGRALSYAMINEMIESDLCTLGSHSVSHPFPSDVKKHQKKGPEAYDQFIRKELGDSQAFLVEKFKEAITTYAYPGGYHTEEMYPIADELGYDHLFTVKPGKVRRDSNKYFLPRYIVLGNNDGAFEAAMIFRNGSLASPIIPVELPHPAKPGAGEIVSSRLPTIQVSLADAPEADLETVVMRVAGFGEVPAKIDPETRKIKWTVIRPLRQPVCEVSVQWRNQLSEDYEAPMKWSFRVDRTASYQAE